MSSIRENRPKAPPLLLLSMLAVLLWSVFSMVEFWDQLKAFSDPTILVLPFKEGTNAKAVEATNKAQELLVGLWHRTQNIFLPLTLLELVTSVVVAFNAVPALVGRASARRWVVQGLAISAVLAVIEYIAMTPYRHELVNIKMVILSARPKEANMNDATLARYVWWEIRAQFAFTLALCALPIAVLQARRSKLYFEAKEAYLKRLLEEDRDE